MGRLTTGEKTPIANTPPTRSMRMGLRIRLIAVACFTIVALSLACMAGCRSSKEEPFAGLGEVVHPPTLGPTPTLSPDSEFDLTAVTDAEGRTTEDVTFESSDGWAYLVIPAGTLVLDSAGQPAEQLTIQPQYSGQLPQDAYGYAPGYGYEIGPNAITFDPAASLVFRFTDEGTAGVIPGDLKIGAALGSEEWHNYSARVDRDAHEIRAQVSSFEPGWRFMILAPIPIGS